MTCQHARAGKFKGYLAQASRFNSTTAPQVSRFPGPSGLRDAVDLETTCRPIPSDRIGFLLWGFGAAVLVVVTMMVIA